MNSLITMLILVFVKISALQNPLNADSAPINIDIIIHNKCKDSALACTQLAFNDCMSCMEYFSTGCSSTSKYEICVKVIHETKFLKSTTVHISSKSSGTINTPSTIGIVVGSVFFGILLIYFIYRKCKGEDCKLRAYWFRFWYPRSQSEAEQQRTFKIKQPNQFGDYPDEHGNYPQHPNLHADNGQQPFIPVEPTTHKNQQYPIKQSQILPM